MGDSIPESGAPRRYSPARRTNVVNIDHINSHETRDYDVVHDGYLAGGYAATNGGREMMYEGGLSASYPERAWQRDTSTMALC